MGVLAGVLEGGDQATTGQNRKHPGPRAGGSGQVAGGQQGMAKAFAVPVVFHFGFDQAAAIVADHGAQMADAGHQAQG